MRYKHKDYGPTIKVTPEVAAKWIGFVNQMREDYDEYLCRTLDVVFPHAWGNPEEFHGN